MRIYRFIILSFCCSSNLVLCAQDTIAKRVIDEIFVVSKPLFLFSTDVILDSLQNYYASNNTLADVLSNESGIFVKSYGLGAIATISNRGGGASQSRVLWNGMDINNPLLGQTDFSLIPISAFESVKISHQNNLSNGGQSGNIVLENNLENKSEKLEINFGVGSFHALNQSVKYVNSDSNKNRFTISIYNMMSENNFFYRENNIVKRRENSDVKNYGITFSDCLKISNKKKIQFNIWYQNNERGVASPLFVINKNENLTNEFFRTHASYTFDGEHLKSLSRFAFADEKLIYTNPSMNLISESVFKKIMFQHEDKILLSEKNHLNLGVHNEYIISESSNFNFFPKRNIFQFIVEDKILFLNNKLSVNTGFNYSYSNDFKIPLTGFLNFQTKFSNAFNGGISVKSNYRLPTFNDLYFMPFQNTKLEMEYTKSAEFFYAYFRQKFSFRQTFFYYNYDGQIVWQPQPNGWWTPLNLDTYAYGIENILQYQTKLNTKYGLKMNGGFYYTKTSLKNQIAQLIYVPILKSNASVAITRQKYFVRLNQNFVGRRYISTDNNNFLESLNYFNISLGMEKKNTFMSLNINNITNNQTAVIQNFPSVGRHFIVSIGFKFENE